LIRIDSRYFRPTEVETLLGDSTKAREKLGWMPKISFKEMVACDLNDARKGDLCIKKGFSIYNHKE
jgi:GDPmannose 4,6-dehydratase